MLIGKRIFSGAAIAAILVVGTMAGSAEARGGPPSGGGGGGGFSIGSCNVGDVLAEGSKAVSCQNFSGNDSVAFLNNSSGLTGDFATSISALGEGTWSLFGKSDEASDSVNDIPEGQKTGTWSFTDGLEDPFVLVLKAAGFYSAYYFDSFDSAVKNGTFNVSGVTTGVGGKSADLSHISVYKFAPRVQPAPQPPRVPEPAALLGLLVVAGFGSRLKRSQAV